MNYKNIIQRLLRGNPNITDEETEAINNQVNAWLHYHQINTYDAPVVWDILLICNIIYNNASNRLSPLDDSKYDALIVLCMRNNIPVPIGAPPVQFKDNPQANLLDSQGDSYDGPKEVLQIIDKDNMYYFNELTKNQYPIKEDFIVDETVTKEYRKQRTAQHQYNLCGTLDKCKYVLCAEAQKHEALSDDSIMIFERDFLSKHIAMGIVNPNNITLVITLKYDGISVEGTIKGDKLISACSRGDTGNDEATDLTPILGGLTFARATNIVDSNETFGAKFEFIITDINLRTIANRFDKHYVNSRNAIIGLLGNLDSRKYRDYLTPVPLETDINFPEGIIPARVRELDFLNKYYTKGIDIRSITIQGSYAEVLYKLNMIYHEANQLRGTMGFQYDGLVVEYAEDHIRKILGKRRSIPNYSIALKFPPLFRRSTFTHYTYSIGQTGVIIPKAHFFPVEFLGQIHDKTTIHSLRRFHILKLRSGDKVDLTLNNDVIVYLQKSPEDVQEPNNNPYEEFPTHCPACGSKLLMSTSGDSIYCPNFNCPERCIGRLANMLSKLNIKGFSTESIRAIGVYNLKQLINTSREYMVSILGPLLGNQMRDMVDKQLLQTSYPDYRILGAMGFSGLAAETWKKILRRIQMQKILYASVEDLLSLKSIPGIGEKTISTIVVERNYMKEDLEIALNQMKPIFTPINGLQSRGLVRFTGSRDKQLCDLFISKGFDAALEGGVTKDTTILVVSILGYLSNSVMKAFKYINNRLSQIPNLNLHVSDYNDLMLLRQKNIQVYPIIISVEEAYQMLDKLS